MACEITAERGGAYQAGSLALFLSAAVILGALAFEYIGGYPPCPLCLMQRYAYYVAIPLLFVALSLSAGGTARAAMWLFALVSVAYLANAGLGVYHAGAEWKFWPGPDTCAPTQGVTAAAGDLMKELETTTVVRCDEPALRILGLSLAGWNVLTSLALFALSLRAAFAASGRA